MRYLIVGLVVLFGGCATTSTADLQKLRKKIEELAQKGEENGRMLDELATRLDLLTDKVDTERVARENSGKPPRLPVIRIKPPVEPEEQQGDAEGGGTKRTSIVDQQAVVYAGRAKKSGPRPVLRLYGSSSDGRVAGTRVEPRPIQVAHKLAVVPIPKRKVGVAAARSDGALEQYRKALADYHAGRFAPAIAAFRSFSKQHADHQYADNALYWLGECYYDTRKYNEAKATFRKVIEQYPRGNKVPDSLLKLALCYLKLGEQRNARSVLQQVVETFPTSNVARLAKDRLTKLK